MNSSIWPNVAFAASVTGAIVTLFCCVPAYKRTKQIGFLLLGCSAIGTLWNVITRRTLGAGLPTHPSGNAFITQGHLILFTLDFALGTMGAVLIARSFVLLLESRNGGSAKPKPENLA
jgi:hypothetical protein